MRLYKFVLFIFLFTFLSFSTKIHAAESLAILSSSPVDGSIPVSVNVNPSLTFSKPLNPATVTSSSVQLREYATAASDAHSVPGELVLSENDTVVTIIPTSPLEYNKQYYLYADSGLKDIDNTQIPVADRWLHANRANHEFKTELAPVGSTSGTIFKFNDELENTALNNGGIYLMTKEGSPYVFQDGLRVTKDITISAEPGVVLEIGNRKVISIENGKLRFTGTVENPVVITSSGSFIQFIVKSDDPAVIPQVSLENVTIEKGDNCFISQRNSINILLNVTFGFCKNAALTAFSSTDLIVKNIKSNASTLPTNSFIYIGLTLQTQLETPMKVSITETDFIQNNFYNIKISDQSNKTYDPAVVFIKINESKFSGSVKDAFPIAIDHKNTNLTIDATENYWGTEEGPYITNTLPKTNGPRLPESVKFQPFKTRDPSTIKECCSSIIFIPGIQGSRLYVKDILNPDGEDQLWEPNWRSDLTELGLGENGNNLDPDIYTKDIIERTNLTEFDPTGSISKYDKNIYKDTISYLNSKKDDNTMSSFVTYPYDWRLDLDEIINNGTKQENGSNQKLVDILRAQAKVSSTGKVTIIAHSMGGLLIKRFVQTLSLADQKLIDNVVMVASPQLGTPEGAEAVLQGVEFKDFAAFVMPQRHTRKLAENMITAQTLSPSDKYFEKVSTKPIVFDQSIYKEISTLSTYGVEINDGGELQDFITGQEGRQDASFEDVNYPNISPTAVVLRAKEIHELIDNYTFPENIKVTQIVGFGSPTTKQIKYVQKKEGKNNTAPSYIPYVTLGGDKTVVQESAAYMNVPTYYINLSKYNKDNNTNASHQNISGLSPVTEIFTSIIKKENVSLNNYVSESPGVSSSRSLFAIGMHSPVDIHLYDSQGRHTGPVYIEIEGETVKFIEENIPNTSYQEHGEDKYIVGIDEESYTLKLDGYETGTFTLEIYKFMDDVEVLVQTFADLPSTTQLSAEISLNPGLPIDQIKLDTSGDLLPDFQVNSDGTVIDLNKPEEVPEEVVIADPNANSPSGENTKTVALIFLPPPTPPARLAKEEILKRVDIETVFRQKTVNIQKPAVKSDIIVESTEVMEPATFSLRNLQLASVASSGWGKRFNLTDLFKRIFNRR